MRESEDHPIGDNDKVKTSRGYDTEMEDFVITENVWDGIGPFEGKNDGEIDEFKIRNRAVFFYCKLLIIKGFSAVQDYSNSC